MSNQRERELIYKELQKRCRNHEDECLCADCKKIGALYLATRKEVN